MQWFGERPSQIWSLFLNFVLEIIMLITRVHTKKDIEDSIEESRVVMNRLGVKSIGLLDEGAAVLSRLTSPTAFWVQTDAPEGFKLLMRRRLEKTMEGDFETDSMRYKATERYDVGFTDPRCAYGTPGI